jgi:hypothetical protein
MRPILDMGLHYAVESVVPKRWTRCYCRCNVIQGWKFEAASSTLEGEAIGEDEEYSAQIICTVHIYRWFTLKC